jgi:hypothetical protein
MCCSNVMAQLVLGFGFVHTRPTGPMQQQIAFGNGAQLKLMYELAQTRFSLGLEAGINIYGQKTSRQFYYFNDGSSVETDVTIQSHFSNFALVGRWELVERKVFTPFFLAKMGYHDFRTNLNIADPEDDDNCRPLENTDLFKDKALSIASGVGLSMNLGKWLNLYEDKMRVDFTALLTRGGQVRYMNVNIPPSNPDDHRHSPRAQSDAVPYYSKFINVRSRVEHEHHVGDVYQNPIRFFDFSVTLLYRIGE